MDIVDRMFELVDVVYKEQKDFAAEIGVSTPTISKWRLKKSASYVKRLEIISKVLDTTPNFLLYGKETPTAVVSELDTLAPDKARLLAAYDRADEKSRALVRLALGLD